MQGVQSLVVLGAQSSSNGVQGCCVREYLSLSGSSRGWLLIIGINVGLGFYDGDRYGEGSGAKDGNC